MRYTTLPSSGPGLVRVRSIGELFDCAELMAKQPRPRGWRLTIHVTNGGGPGVMAAEHPCPLRRGSGAAYAEIIRKLNAFLPPFWSRNNPIDILGDASGERFRRTLEVCFDGKDTDGVCVIVAPQALTDTALLAETLSSMMEGRRFPVFACWLGGARGRRIGILNRSGIPTYGTPEQAVRAFLYMVEYARNMESLLEIPPKLTTHIAFDPDTVRHLLTKAPLNRFMSESDAKEVLSAYGLPVIRTELADSEEEAADWGNSWDIRWS